MNSQLLNMVGNSRSQTTFADTDSNASLTRRADSCILKLKGLPYDTTKEHVLEFFTDFKVHEISFVYEPDGRPSGLAFAEFESQEEALRAMSKNGEYIGRRYVKLLMVPREEMEDQVRLGTLAIPGAAARAARVAQMRNRRVQAAPRVTYPAYPSSVSLQYWAAGRLSDGITSNPQLVPTMVMPTTPPSVMPTAMHHRSDFSDSLHLLQASTGMRTGISWLDPSGAATYHQVIDPVASLPPDSSLQPVQNSTTLRIRGLPFKEVR